MSMINAFLGTGKAILDLERQLAGLPSTDPSRRRLSAEHARLMRRQRDEIVAAHRAGVDWDMITFALALHGQSADRDVGSTAPTPAEQLLALMREYGGPAVAEALSRCRTAPTGGMLERKADGTVADEQARGQGQRPADREERSREGDQAQLAPQSRP
jgi:hypothetical protein